MEGGRFTIINGGNSSSSSSNRRSRDEVGMVVMRKGPWMAEEDEILLDYVGKHGPRDWSSIRSKGLLPRTGKSCRLRWVNKLKPDLKTGCKFSAEEKRIVIDLQSQFGNKWARIATYLPGRTDNDVKNFWSTRQKRLARLLRSTSLPPPRPRSHKNHGKLPNVHHHQFPAFADSNLDHISFGDELSNGQCSENSSTNFSDSTKMVQMPLLYSQNFLNLDTSLSLLEPDTNRNLCLSSNTQPEELEFNHLALPPLELPLLLEGPDLIPELGDMSFKDEFGRDEAGSIGIKTEDANNGMLDGFFDELPADMFDYMDPPPPDSAAW